MAQRSAIYLKGRKDKSSCPRNPPHVKAEPEEKEDDGSRLYVHRNIGSESNVEYWRQRLSSEAERRARGKEERAKKRHIIFMDNALAEPLPQKKPKGSVFDKKDEES